MVSGRPSRYHRAPRRDAWLYALRKLHLLGWSARRIAEALSGLDDDALELLRSRGWDESSVEDAVEPGSSPVPWTPRQVQYWRRKLGIVPLQWWLVEDRQGVIIRHGPFDTEEQAHDLEKSKGPPPSCVRFLVTSTVIPYEVHIRAGEADRDSRRRFMVDRGWLHLLPAYVEPDPPRGVAGHWSRGVELSRTAVLVLCLLRDQGPQTRRQVAGALGLGDDLRRLRGGRGRSVLGDLRAAGLVRVVRHAREGHSVRRVYALADAAVPADPTVIPGWNQYIHRECG